MFCNNCGHRNPTGANFCSSCGAALSDLSSDTTISFVPLDGPTDEEFTVTLPERPQGASLLIVKRGPTAGQRFVLDADIVRAGRHPDSDVFLDDITVSRRHAEFTKDGKDHVVRDVKSLNGTYVNGERIDEAVLANGDEVQIGKFKLLYLAAADD